MMLAVCLTACRATTISGADFAHTLFAGRLGVKTPSPALKAGLLGLRSTDNPPVRDCLRVNSVNS
jgi:hypothetical protein